MKKEWIKFLGCIAIGLAIFTSCNKDNMEPGDNNDPEVITGETAMFSALINNLDIDLPVSDSGTKAAGDENKVTDVRVVLFNTDTNGTVEYSWDIGVRYTGTGFEGPDVAGSGTDNVTTTARLVKYQNYHMVVLVNPS
ncbi:MAG: hypothetical protein LUE98_01630 [Tannerellaceae bacterium]|nr:hypothetical protein [Tannerellaceae bacterium]